ncbi:MAG: hypothetical protein HEQ16_04975 [Bosea sp.]|jgi:hypothetical protein|nr:hypothetical protein [Bosea sp. (in: a-proteobacteria)]
MSATNDFENALLAHALGSAPLAMPAANWLALFTGDPGEAGSTATEIAGAGYQRQAVAFTAPVSGSASNAADITFPAANGAAWGTISHWAIMSAQAGGTMRIKGSFQTPRLIADTDTLVVRAGDITASLD